MSYNRLTKEKSTSKNTKIVYNENGFAIFEKQLIETFLKEHNRLWELENKIENGTLKEVDNKVYPPNKSIGVWGDYCSKCGGLIGENGYEENYCSHCGAKLNEQQNDL